MTTWRVPSGRSWAAGWLGVRVADKEKPGCPGPGDRVFDLLEPDWYQPSIVLTIEASRSPRSVRP